MLFRPQQTLAIVTAAAAAAAASVIIYISLSQAERRELDRGGQGQCIELEATVIII
jgi:hypothetical protein